MPRRLRARVTALFLALVLALGALVATAPVSAALSITASVAANPAGSGYWTQQPFGGVVAHGGAPFYGSTRSGIYGIIVANPRGGGYWVVDQDFGQVFAFGNARALPSFPNGSGFRPENDGELTAVAATPDGGGLLGLDIKGHVWTLGNAVSYGDASRLLGAASATGIATVPGGRGYWIVDTRGGVYAFPSGTPFYGSLGGRSTVSIAGIAPTRDGGGYWLADEHGGVTPFGNATLQPGTLTDTGRNVAGISADADSGGYYLVHQGGTVDAFGELVTGPPSPRDRADLAVTLDAPRSVRRDRTVHYALRIVNRGPDTAVTPAASLTLPAGFKVTEVYQQGERRDRVWQGGQSVQWAVPSVGRGVSTTLLISGIWTRPGNELCATATVASPDTRDTSPRNNTQRACAKSG